MHCVHCLEVSLYNHMIFNLLINPQRMHEGYGSHSVCLCVCYRTSCYIPRLYVENKVPLGFLFEWYNKYEKY